MKDSDGDGPQSYICHIFKITGVSGSENHLLTLASHLDRSRYRLTFCLLVEREPDLSAYIAALEAVGVKVARFPIHADLDPLLLWRLVRFLRTRQPDIVHTHLIHGDLYGTLAAGLARVPHVVSTRHNDNTFRRWPLFGRLHNSVSKRQDHIITISEHLKRFTVEIEGVNPEKVTPIHYGLAPRQSADSMLAARAMRTELGIPDDALLVGIVARLTEQKGHTHLFAAWQQVMHVLPDAHLLVVGDGPLRDFLQTLAKDRNLTGSITFTGYRSDVPRIMSALDVMVLPSFWEGFGLVLLEAMSAGKPIVASRVSAIPEIVVDGETGLLVPPGDLHSLAQALLKVLQDPERGRRMGRKGRARLEREFGVEKMVCATEHVYDALLDSKQNG
jgi:glycosyltransferase involved in cell wall biosynthesis